jgi:hypothetical protein
VSDGNIYILLLLLLLLLLNVHLRHVSAQVCHLQGEPNASSEKPIATGKVLFVSH